MITPLSLDDVESATDAEIIAAYIKDGFSEETARGYLAALRNADPAFLVD